MEPEDGLLEKEFIIFYQTSMTLGVKILIFGGGIGTILMSIYHNIIPIGIIPIHFGVPIFQVFFVGWDTPT